MANMQGLIQRIDSIKKAQASLGDELVHRRACIDNIINELQIMNQGLKEKLRIKNSQPPKVEDVATGGENVSS